jgi:arylformamidase
MRYYDISVPVSASLPVYDGDPPVELALRQAMARGDIADVRSLSMGVHCGTHLDAPAHFLPGGTTIDRTDPMAGIGPAVVIDLSSLAGETIGRADLASRLPAGVERVLLRTRSSALWRQATFSQDFVALAPEAAALLVEHRLRLVGIDYLSIAPASDPGPVHRALLQAGVLILEGLDLSAVPAGSYTLVCLPLRLEGAEAAPTRAVLLAEDDIIPH